MFTLSMGGEYLKFSKISVIWLVWDHEANCFAGFNLHFRLEELLLKEGVEVLRFLNSDAYIHNVPNLNRISYRPKKKKK